MLYPLLIGFMVLLASHTHTHTRVDYMFVSLSAVCACRKLLVAMYFVLRQMVIALYLCR